MTQDSCKRTQQCCSIAGAGDLISHIWRLETGHDLPEYGSTIGLSDATTGFGSAVYRPSDLESFPKLLQVVARELVHDGGFGAEQRTWLNRFADEIGCFDSRMNSQAPVLLSRHEVTALFSLLRDVACRNDLTKTKHDDQRFQAERLSEMLQRHLPAKA